MVVILTVVEGWIDFHFDLNGAYLDSNIDTDVYVDQAAGLDPVVGPNGERMCMKLDKAIYGTVQAARLLFTKKFRATLVSIGFEVSLDDEAVYRLDHKLGRIVLATHVDDGIGGASTTAVLEWMYAEIIKHGFSFSQQGGWHTILGFGAKRDLVNRTVTISAGGHIRDLVRMHLVDEVATTLNPPTPTARTIMDLQPAGEETAAEASLHTAWRANAPQRISDLRSADPSRHCARGQSSVRARGHADARILRRSQTHPRLAVSPCGSRGHLRCLALEKCNRSTAAQGGPPPHGRHSRLGTADAVVDVRGEDDTAELVIEAVNSLVVERDFEADVDERGTKFLGEEASSLNGAVDRLVEFHAHALAVGSDDGVEAGCLIDVDIGIDIGVEVGAVQVEVEVEPPFDDCEDDDRLDAGAAGA